MHSFPTQQASCSYNSSVVELPGYLWLRQHINKLGSEGRYCGQN